MLALTLALSASLAQLPPAPWLTGVSQPEDLVITLVTFSPGDEVPEWWGHTAMVVKDQRSGEQRFYNYGMFGFDHFFQQFAMGRLRFWVSDDQDANLTFAFYQQRLDRDVRLQELDLLPAQAATIARRLAENVLPANRYYLYQHYTDNCSTRPRDIIDEGVGGQLKAATAGPARMSLRAHTLRYSQVSPPMSLVLDFLQNDTLDQPLTQQGEAYLPDELERQVQQLVVKRPDGTQAPLVKRQWNFYRSKRAPPPEVPPNWLPQLVLLGLALAGVVLGLGHLGRGGARAPRAALGLLLFLVGLVGGVFGTVLLFMATVTDHAVTYHNENLFLFNPLHLALVVLGPMYAFGSARAGRGLARVTRLIAGLVVAGVALKALPAFDQANWNLLALLGPLDLSLGALFWLEARAQARRGAG